MPESRPLLAFHFFGLAQGGVERMMIELAPEFLARGYAVDFVLVKAVGELRPLVPAGVRIVDLDAKRTLGSILPLARYFRREQPAAMFASLGPQNIAAIVARRIARSRSWLGVMQHNALSIQARAGISAQQSLVPLMYRIFLPHADRVIAVSRGVADDLATATGYPRDSICVLYNAACPDDADEKAALRPEHPLLSAGVPLVLGVGRLVPQKGWDVAIRAFAQVVKQRPAQLAIAGVGPDEAALSRLIAELGLADHVHLLGFQAQPLGWMAAADLVLMSSRYEGFGNVLVEALAVGTPVVSTDCNFGPAEILEDGKWGRLAPVDDVDALARAILESLDAKPDRDALRARARAFSVSSVAERYLQTAFGA